MDAFDVDTLNEVPDQNLQAHRKAEIIIRSKCHGLFTLFSEIDVYRMRHMITSSRS